MILEILACQEMEQVGSFSPQMPELHFKVLLFHGYGIMCVFLYCRWKMFQHWFLESLCL